MKIRLVKKSDLKALSEVYSRAYNEADIGEKWKPESAEKLLAHFLEYQPDLFFLTEREGNVFGAIVALVRPWWDGNHIADGEFFVDPKQQGKGAGKQLLKHLFTKARQKYGAVSWDTFTHVVHKHPLSFYKKIGFEEIKEWTMISGDIEVVLKNLED